MQPHPFKKKVQDVHMQFLLQYVLEGLSIVPMLPHNSLVQ